MGYAVTDNYYSLRVTVKDRVSFFIDGERYQIARQLGHMNIWFKPPEVLTLCTAVKFLEVGAGRRFSVEIDNEWEGPSVDIHLSHAERPDEPCVCSIPESINQRLEFNKKEAA